MNFPFLDKWRKWYVPAPGLAVSGGDGAAEGFAGHERPGGAAGGGPDAGPADAGRADEGMAELLAECDLLRSQAEDAGVELDDTAASLEALDQLLPRWRDDPEAAGWLGTDAGLYLGTVIVRTVPGAHWRLWPDGQAVVELASGREIDVVETGAGWARTGTPELSQVYAEVSEV